MLELLWISKFFVFGHIVPSVGFSLFLSTAQLIALKILVALTILLDAPCMFRLRSQFESMHNGADTCRVLLLFGRRALCGLWRPYKCF